MFAQGKKNAVFMEILHAKLQQELKVHFLIFARQMALIVTEALFWPFFSSLEGIIKFFQAPKREKTKHAKSHLTHMAFGRPDASSLFSL